MMSANYSDKKMLDDNLLQKYIDKFLGYGDFNAKCWFIGMEHGGGGNYEELAKRLEVWSELGRKELEDVVEYHKKLNIEGLNWFCDKPKIQPTWSKLIRILLSIDDNIDNLSASKVLDKIRMYQKQSFGRSNSGETCLLELSPMPSPNIRNNKWQEWTNMFKIDNYKTFILKYNTDKIKALINGREPEVVVFYGVSYRSYWEEIADCDFEEQNGIFFTSNKSTLFVMIKHPVSRGVKNEYFHEVGKMIREKCGHPMTKAIQ
jgi:hypothetical protein